MAKKILGGVSIKEELIKKIALTAAVEGRSKSNIVEVSLEEYFANHPEKSYTVNKPETI